MELKKVRVADIKPYPNNPRRNDEAVDAVAESIRQCGYCAPIVVDENMVILAGHTRHKALQKLGMMDCEVVIKSGLNDAQKRKYRLLDNKTGEVAGWDFEKLEIELDGLDFDGFDFKFDAGGLLPPIPENLDKDVDDEEKKLSVKLTFENYTAYSEHEDELKRIALEMGAEFSVTHT